MMLRDGVVLSQRRRYGAAGRQCCECRVRVTQAPDSATAVLPGEEVTVVAYEQLMGLPEAGERVRIEVSALAKALGTGGFGMVIDRLDALLPDDLPAGHLVKARYMPTQVMVTGIDEQSSTAHGLFSSSEGAQVPLSLDSCPVVVADLHSTLPAIVAGILWTRPHTRIAYVMTDGGALPAPLSRTVAALREAGLITSVTTVGQAWGGDYEAVTVHNGLLAARHCGDAEVIIVAQGPGNLGTGTTWGFSGLACGEALNAVTVLGGRSIACPRVSQADLRPRHRGLSHHTLTMLEHVALHPTELPLPAAWLSAGRMPAADSREAHSSTVGASSGASRDVFPDARERASMHDALAALQTRSQHRVIPIDVDVTVPARVADPAHTTDPARSGAVAPVALPERFVLGSLGEALDVMDTQVTRLSTMGRGYRQDPAAFLAAAVAGHYAALWCDAHQQDAVVGGGAGR